MFTHYLRHVIGVLREEAGEGAAGGAAAENKGGAAFDPEAFKASFKTEILGEFDKKLNGLSKGHKKDFEKFTTDLLAKIGGGGTADDGGSKSGEGEGNKGGGKGGDADANAWRLKMEKQLADAQAEIKKHSDRAESAEKNARESKRVGDLKSTLGGIKDLVDDKAQTALFKIMDRDVDYDEDGEIIFKTEKGALPLTTEAIRGWIEAEYPRFLAPKGSGGAGAKSGGKRGGEYVPQITDDVSKLTDEQFKVFSAAAAEAAKRAALGQ